MDTLERRYDVSGRNSAGIVLNFLSGLILLMILYPVTVVGTKWLSASPWYGVLSGILLMLVALLCHRFGAEHKLLYACSLLLNGIGNGLSLSSLYVYEAISTDVARNLSGFIPAVGLLLLGMLLLLLFPQRKKAVVLGLLVLFFLTLGACVLGMMKTTVVDGAAWRLSVFTLLLAGAFLLAMVLQAANPECSELCSASLAGFCAYLLITVIVIAVMGELLDSLDSIDIFSGIGKKGKMKKG